MEISKKDLENQKVVKEDGFMFEHRTEQFKVTKKLKQDFNNVETAIKYANRFAPIFSNSLNSVVNNSNALSKVVDIKKEPSLREKTKRKPINEINDVLRASLYFSNQKEIVKFCNKLLDGYINIPDSELIEYDGRRLFNAVGDNPYRGAVHLLLLLKAFNTYMVVELQLMLDKQEEKGKIHSLYKIQSPPVNNPNYVRDRMDKGFERMLGERKPKYYTNKDYANRNKYYGEIDENFNEVTKGELEEAKKKKSDRCTRIAKSKYDVWPSAYASGAVVKCRQGKIWKGLKEEEENNTDKKKIYVLVGPPSIGKSTWIKNTFADIQPYVISRDNIVEQVADNLGWTYDDLFVAPPQGSQLGDYDEKYGEVIKSPSYMSWQPLSFSKVLEANNQVHLSFTKLVSNAVNSEKDIVVDMTNMTAGARKNALKAIEGNESFFEKIAVVFPFEGAEDIIIDVARKRAEAAKRMGKSKTLPDSVMRKMFASFQNVSPEEGFDKVVQQDNRELLSTLNEKWSKKYKKSIDCNNPKGFSQKAHCKGRLKEEETPKGKIRFEKEHLDHYDGQDNYELGVYEDDEIIGYVQYVIFENEITVSDILVRPNRRRENFGSMLIQKMKQLHPYAKYKPSLKTDLGSKFIHKDVDVNEQLDEKTDYSKVVKPILNKGINIKSSDGRKGLVPISELEEFIGEDRLGAAQMPTSRATIDKLKKDISENGFELPIIIFYDKFSGNGEATIIEGNHRIIAAKELGLTEVPVIFEKGTIRDNESRINNKMFPIKRKTIGKIDDTFGVRGSDLGLTVRQPTEADFVKPTEQSQADSVNDDEQLNEKTDFSKEKKQGLHGWFARQGGKGKSKGWVDCNTCRDGKCKSCGRKEGESRSKYPACRPTPSACKTRGKGKSWGKKSTNEDILNEQSKQDIEKELKLNEIKNTFKRLLK